MNAKLTVFNPSVLSDDERRELESNIDNLIEAHKNNRQEINRLVFESVSAMTMGDDYERELSNKKGLKRFIGNITGSNKKLQDKINSSRSAAQYASQQTLQRLAEQNLMSFELITAVNNKLNASVVAIEGELNQIYDILIKYFKQNRSEMVRLGSRVDLLERNVNLLTWLNSIEYQTFNGVDYADLDDVSKIVCLTRDFYDITKAEWTTSDLLLFKSAMSTVGINPKKEIGYFDFIKSLYYRNDLKAYLLNSICIEQPPEPYLIPVSGLKKLDSLGAEEAYITESVVDLMNTNGIHLNNQEARELLARKYLESTNNISVDDQVTYYDLILELLFNLVQFYGITEIHNNLDNTEDNHNTNTTDEHIVKNTESESNDVLELERMFSEYRIEKVVPLAKKLIESNNSKALYVMGIIFERGYTDIPMDSKKAFRYLKKAYENGYLPALARLCLPVYEQAQLDKKILFENIDKLEELADLGDMFASEEFARICINYSFLTGENNKYEQAIAYFKNAPKALGLYGLAKSYDNGQGVLKDYKKSFELYMEAADYGYPPAEYELARALCNGWGCTTDKNAGFNYYLKAESHGYIDAISKVANCYIEGIGVDKDEQKGFTYYLKGANMGNLLCISNLGWCYRYGHGTNCDIDKALEWFKKAASMEDDGYANYHAGEIYRSWKNNDTMAGKFYRIAAEMGSYDAINELNGGGSLLRASGLDWDDLDRLRKKHGY